VDGSSTSRGAAAALREAGVRSVLEVGDDEYQDAVAGFDLGVTVAPDVVVDAGTPGEVAAAVAVAVDRREPVTILGSGHGRLSEVRGGLAITLRSMDAVEVDASAQTVRVGAGCTWEPVLAATTPLGLAAPCGSAPAVGVVGYVLGGGLGPLASAFGFSCDHVRSFDIVTPADGAITVSADSHPDLFWALRGGKGGFGVITAVTIELLTVSDIYGGGIYFDADDAAGVLAAYAEWAPALPESSTTSIALLRLPPSDALPEAIRGRHVAYVRFASLDPVAQAEAQLADMRGVAKSLLDTVGVLPYGHIGQIHGDPVAPMPVANGAESLASLGADTVAAVLAAADLGSDLPLSSVEIRTLGPATRRQPPVPDAVGGRSTAHLLNVYAAPNPSLDDKARLDAVRAVLDAAAPWRAPVNLVNFVGRANAPDAIERSWTPEQNDRLDAIRTTHDPDALFPYGRHGASAAGDGDAE
jgi:FAD/FMN-containing dehydrogenase